MAVIESPIFSTRTSTNGNEEVTSRLDTYVLRALPADLLTVLRGVAFQELDGQVTSGNLPSQILVDGRSVSRRGIIEATRSVSMRFADTATLVEAIKAAYAILLRVTRIQNPAMNNIVARKNFWLYMNGKSVGLLPGAFTKLTPDKLNHKTILRVVGPLVNYGRKLYWNPIGRSKVMELRQTESLSGRQVFHYDTQLSPRFKPMRMRTLRKLANSKGGNPAENLKSLLSNHPGSVEGANQIAKRVLKRDRRFVALHISDGWVSYPPAGSWGKTSRNDRVPSLSVQLARKGGLKVISIL
jgi:hypothetical protein